MRTDIKNSTDFEAKGEHQPMGQCGAKTHGSKQSTAADAQKPYGLRQKRMPSRKYEDFCCTGDEEFEQQLDKYCKPARGDTSKRHKWANSGPTHVHPTSSQPNKNAAAPDSVNDFSSQPLARSQTDKPCESSANAAAVEPYQTQSISAGKCSSTSAAATTAAVLEVPAAPPASSSSWAADGQHSSSASAASACPHPPARAVSQHVSARTAARRQAARKLVCTNCGATHRAGSKAHTWMPGPAGPKSLCNRCGIDYYRRKAAAIIPGSTAAQALAASQLAADPAAVVHHGSEVQLAADPAGAHSSDSQIMVIDSEPLLSRNSSVVNTVGVAAQPVNGITSRRSSRLAAAASESQKNRSSAVEQSTDGVPVPTNTLSKAQQLQNGTKRMRDSDGEEESKPASSKKACSAQAAHVGDTVGYAAVPMQGDISMSTAHEDLPYAQAVDLLGMVAPGGCSLRVRRSRRIDERKKKKQSKAATPVTTAMPAVDEVAQAAGILMWMAQNC